MHAKLIYQSRSLSPTSASNDEPFRPWLPCKATADWTSAAQNVDISPVHLEGTLMREHPVAGARIFSNPFRSGGAFSGVLKELTNNDSNAGITLSRTSSANRLERSAEYGDYMKEDKASAMKITVVKPQASRASVNLPIRPLVASSKNGIIKKTSSVSKNAIRAFGIAPRGRTPPREAGNPAPQKRAMFASMSARRTTGGARPVIDMRRRAIARLAAIRVLKTLDPAKLVCALGPKNSSENTITFKARTNSGKVDVPKIWESAVKFFEAEHAHRHGGPLPANQG